MSSQQRVTSSPSARAEGLKNTVTAWAAPAPAAASAPAAGLPQVSLKEGTFKKPQQNNLKKTLD